MQENLLTSTGLANDPYTQYAFTMYGLINKAIEDLVLTEFGEEPWEKIKIKANVQVETFLAMESYPDEITYNLVGAAAQVLNLPAETILKIGRAHV